MKVLLFDVNITLTILLQHQNKWNWLPSLCTLYIIGITRLQLIWSTEREPSIYVKINITKSIPFCPVMYKTAKGHFFFCECFKADRFPIQSQHVSLQDFFHNNTCFLGLNLEAGPVHSKNVFGSHLQHNFSYWDDSWWICK